MLRWYLIHTKAQSEAVAQSNLERQCFEVYFPRLQHRGLRRDRWMEVVVPLFPRYLFLRLDEGRQSLGPVRSTVGVAGVVRFGSTYAVVPDLVVRKLRARGDAQTGLHQLSPWALTAGSRVRIAIGPFSGLEGIFEREDGADRAVVLLDLLGQQATVKVSAACLCPTTA